MAPTAVEGSDRLPIRIKSRRLVKASDTSIEPHFATVSNLDLYVGKIQEFIVCLYPKLPKGSHFKDVVNTFETGLPSLLNYFYPLAGRISTSSSSGLPEIDCGNQGAELIVGEVDVALGSLDYGVATGSLKKIMLPFAEDVPLSVQLLSFACGRFAVVWGNNHLLCDGYGATMLIGMWCELARTGIIASGGPNHDRSMFCRPRDPPSYSAKLDDILTTLEEHRLVNALTAQDSFVDRLYYIEASDIARLREMASTREQRSTRVQAVSAYLWKVLATVVAASRVPEARCRMGWWVDGRRRLTSPKLASALRGYFGNVASYALADATVEEIERKPLADVAAMVREAITSINYDEYIAELVDYVEVHKNQGLMESAVIGLGAPTLSQSAFVSFQIDTDFGFGEAKLAMPVSDFARLCSAYVSISARPGEDGSWLVSAYVWPRLAAALESDGKRIFKPLTAEYLGLI